MWHYIPKILSQSLLGQQILQKDWCSKDTNRKTQCNHFFHKRVQDPDSVGCTQNKRMRKCLQSSVWPNSLLLYLFPIYLYLNISLFNNKTFGGTFNHRSTYHALLSPSKISFLGDSMYAWSLMVTSQGNEREGVLTLQCSSLRSFFIQKAIKLLISGLHCRGNKKCISYAACSAVWYCPVTAHNPFVNNCARTARTALLPPACTFQQTHSSNTHCLMTKHTAKSSSAQILMPPLSWLFLSCPYHPMSPAFHLFRALLSETLCCPQLLSYLDLVPLRKPQVYLLHPVFFIW